MKMGLGNIGLIGRFKPLHNGGALMLEAVCEQAEKVIIGIGSSNKYNLRNPFTAKETQEMINLYLHPRFNNYSFLEIPDFGQIPEYAGGQKWTEHILEHYGKLDHFVSGNDHVTKLLKPHYDVIHPATLIPPEQHLWIKGTTVRMEMARGGDWKSLVPGVVAEYLVQKGLVERFRKEFGLETLALLSSGIDYRVHEDAETEQKHTRE